MVEKTIFIKLILILSQSFICTGGIDIINILVIVSQKKLFSFPLKRAVLILAKMIKKIKI